jgi:basic membrane protein A
MREEAPEAVLTSTVWNWGIYYSRLVLSVIDGTFTTEPYFGGLNEGVVGLAPFNEGLLPAGAAEAVADGRRRIESGEFDVFDGVMETNDGLTIGEEGARLTDAEIWTSLNWYYRNVVEVR